MKIKKGYLFVFEGPDNVGKTTVINELYFRLKKRGLPSTAFAFPGNRDGSLGKLVYELHHNSENYNVFKINPKSLQLLHVASHIDTIETEIIPALNHGEIVLLDRFWWSTYVYGMIYGLNKSLLKDIVKLENKSWNHYKPDTVFLLKRNIDIQESNDVYHSLAQKYNELAMKMKLDYKVEYIENNGPISLVVDYIEDIVDKCIIKKKQSITELLQERGSIHNSIDFTNQYEQLNLFDNEKKHSYPYISFYIKNTLAKASKVFDTYWFFAAERQEIFNKRLRGKEAPWTEDQILRKYKFTNAYRASDRVSQYLIQNVIYSGNFAEEDLFFRIILFKTFNKIETWEMLERNLGEISFKNYSFDVYDKLLSTKLSLGNTIYSAAYIMASGGTLFGHTKKHQNHLKLIELMMKDKLPKKITEQKSMEDLYRLLLLYPTIGTFLAYQYCIDLNYSELCNFNEMDFVIPGPGARDGIRKCFIDIRDFDEEGIIKYMADKQQDEFTRLGIKFKSLWGRPLQLIDCQNLFCEVDKYSRIAHPDVAGISNRTRIKQLFTPMSENINYWYPPKWGINSKIKMGLNEND